MNIGGQELIIIFAIALIVFGPKRLPEIARFLSKAVREMRRAIDEIKHDVSEHDKYEG
jgi:sec-independent protein translocase protein TatA